MDISGFKVEDFLPLYLTDHQKAELGKAMAEFTPKSNLYTGLYPDDALQGDCWDEVPYVDFSSMVRRQAKGVVLSNSCDIDPSNNRDFPVQLMFAPLISLQKYKLALQAGGHLTGKAIADKVEAIKKQQITNLIFFPAYGRLTEDCIAVLDRVASIPFEHFPIQDSSKKIFTLNQLGHYLFSFKVSIHFCRIHEALARD